MITKEFEKIYSEKRYRVTPYKPNKDELVLGVVVPQRSVLSHLGWIVQETKEKHKFVYESDMVDGALAVGVVYHKARERDIRRVFHELDRDAPKVYGYVVVERDDEEDEE